MTLEVDQKAREFLAQEGYEPQYGARPLRRAIQKHLLDPLALAILDGRFQEYNGLVVWKCGEVTKYRVDNVRIATHQNMLIMNLAKYNSLPADIRKAIDDSTGFNFSAASGDVWAKAEDESKAAILAQDKAKGNPAPYVLPDAERARWIAAAQPVIDAWLKDMADKGQGSVAQNLLDKTKQWVKDYSN